ncbi:MAG TPA: B12-binding domain-containing radical SAM protein, partial [Desulfobaccales bacterium]|nr:B12-binding domain-containing radical SAM protein [Desulfobaccales bacterium]
MKALLLYPELPYSFWSLKETCKISGRKTLLPPLGLLTAAALLPQEWEFRLVDLNTRPLSDTDWEWGDLVLISGMIIQQNDILRLVREAKQRGKISVAGGPYATSLPGPVLEAGVDFLVQGEGEVTIPYFVDALGEGVRGGVYQEDRKPDLATSPVPRFDLLNFADYNDMSIQTSRGCPYNCEFCDIVNLFGRVPRYKSPEQVVRELETLYRLGWRRHVFISDDNFIGNKEHARAILSQMVPWNESRGQPFGFWSQASVNLGQDHELIDLMTEANFNSVFLGVETPETSILRRSRKYHNLRQPLTESLVTINARGLSLVGSFIIGFDDERTGAGDRIYEFVEECNIPMVMLNLLEVLPNTRLWDRLAQEGRLLPGQTSGDFFDLSLNYRPTRRRKEILEEYVRALDRIYEPCGYLARVYRYYLNMRPTRRALALGKGGEAKVPPSAHRPYLNSNGKELRSLVNLLWRQGIRPPYRWQFWRQLLGIYRHNPSRLKTYLISCAMAENF